MEFVHNIVLEVEGRKICSDRSRIRRRSAVNYVTEGNDENTVLLSYFIYLKTSENFWFSDVFRGYRKINDIQLVKSWKKNTPLVRKLNVYNTSTFSSECAQDVLWTSYARLICVLGTRKVPQLRHSVFFIVYLEYIQLIYVAFLKKVKMLKLGEKNESKYSINISLGKNLSFCWL